jgi:hypothetical protein
MHKCAVTLGEFADQLADCLLRLWVLPQVLLLTRSTS